MIFNIKNLSTFIVKILGETLPKFSPQIGSKLSFIHLRKYMHDFSYEKNTAQKMKFSIKDFSSKCDQIRSAQRNL